MNFDINADLNQIKKTNMKKVFHFSVGIIAVIAWISALNCLINHSQDTTLVAVSFFEACGFASLFLLTGKQLNKAK